MQFQLENLVDWKEQLDEVYNLMREMSLQTNPQEMVAAYARRMSKIFPVDRRLSLSRRGLQSPQFRITRNSQWKDPINPWKEKHRLPLLSGGLLAELIYSDQPKVIDQIDLADDDPAAPFLEGQQSLMAIPMLDKGKSLNMIVLARKEPAAFERESLPQHVWLANLFGRATHNLVLTDKVREAYEMVDRELKVVAEIQQTLLPGKMPEIPHLELAAYYQTSHRAGGDYYDFFKLADGKWGLLIADVSGHGTPAAVVMAITHSIAHLAPNPPDRPSEFLTFVNQQLATRYTTGFGAFVTAFYGVFDPKTLQFTYSSAGHNPPRLKRCTTGEVVALDKAASLPLGIAPDIDFDNHTMQLAPRDRLILYTDGITEAHDCDGAMFGVEPLDKLLARGCGDSPREIVDSVIQTVNDFTCGKDADDDRTLLVAEIG